MITIIYLFLFIFLINTYFYNASYSPYITYISYYNSNSININDINYNNYQNLDLVKNGDDFPFESINLPWNFNFFGSTINSIYVSPNGAIHTMPTQPCPRSNAFLNSGDCENFNGTYYALIAGRISIA